MLKVEQLSVKLGALQFAFDLAVGRGECLAILGESGSGKSTLLNLLGGFLPSEAGKVTLDGEDFTQQPPDQRPVTTLFQDNNLFTHLSVRDNLGLGIDPGLKLTAKEWQRVDAQLEAVGLAALAKRKPGQLSGGQAQRVALARSLLRDKPVLLLDEPFSALDEATRAQMLMLTDDVIRQHQLCCVLVTHNREDAVSLKAQLRYLQDGRLQEPPV